MTSRSAGRASRRASNGTRALLGTLASAALCAGGLSIASAPAQERDPFPHARHEGLFPSCQPCHEGAWSKEAPIYSVGADDCARCHDDVTLAHVAWAPPTREIALNVFDHETHVIGAEVECADCHGGADPEERMAVILPGPDRCLECHGSGESHFQEPSCEPCHRPLTAIAALSPERIAAIQPPPDHASEEFLFVHGSLAESDSLRCSICHARQTCESCHLNAGALAPIQSLEPDARVLLQAQRIQVRWPRPVSHDEPDWLEEHGAQPDSLAGCGNCHARQTCQGCHGEGLQALNALPTAVAGGPAGALIARARPRDHHPWFATEHAAAALTSANCASCHAPTFCQTCHDVDAPGARNLEVPAHRNSFHPANFLERHAADAYGRDVDCSGCHSNETFCRDCHAESGVSPSDSRTSAYHDSQPFWLLNHGSAARQGMESCASCHQQTDCLQCHSAKSGWRINPHGPDFDPDAMGDRSLETCAQCHFADPRQ